MKKGKLIAIIIVGAITLLGIVLGLIFYFVTGTLKNVEQASYYEVGGEKVVSIKEVVGERNVTGINKAKSTEGPSNSYTYSSETTSTDLSNYAKYLMEEEDYTPTLDYDFNKISGVTQFAKDAEDANKVIVIDIEYSSNKYTIKVSKQKGSLIKKE